VTAPDDPTETPGLQAERTVLAYWRTELAAFVVALLVVRQASAGAERAVVAVTSGLAIVALTMAGVWRRRLILAGATGAAPRSTLIMTAAVALLQLLALVVVL
jgi:hypothetical protein